MRAIRDDEEAALAMGKNVGRRHMQPLSSALQLSGSVEQCCDLGSLIFTDQTGCTGLIISEQFVWRIQLVVATQ